MRHKAFLWSLAVMLLVGVFDMTRSITGPLMQKTFSLSYGELGVLFACVSIGYLAGSMSCGWVLNHLEVKVAALIGGFVTTVGFVLTGSSAHALTAMAGFALTGLGSGWMEVSVNALVPILAIVPRSEANRELVQTESQQAGMFNILHGLYGVGAFAFPVVATWLIVRLGGWKPLLTGIAVLIVIVMAVGWLTRFPITTPAKSRDGRSHGGQEAPDTGTGSATPELSLVMAPPTAEVMDTAAFALTASSHTAQASDVQKLRVSLPLIGLLIAITAYVMAEVGIGAWLPTYLVHGRQLSLSNSSLYLSGFYATFTAGRLLGHFWVARVGHRRAIFWSTIFGFVFIVLGELQTNWTFAFIIAGIGFAIIFPTITAIASETFPAQSGKVLGLLFTSAGIGSMVVSWLIGGIASWLGLGAAFIVIPLCLAGSLGGLWLSKSEPVLQS